MFRHFFLNRKWWLWSVGGSVLILWATWYKVQLDVEINEWFGAFYNDIEKILKKPHSVTFPEFFHEVMTFAKIAALYIIIAVLIDFFGRHYIFRWRTAMTEYYQANWHRVRHIEGASQRIQEDTMRFAKIMETLGVSLLRAVLTLIVFIPVLREGSKVVRELPWIGEVDDSLVFVALIFSVVGTVALAIIGIKLPGLEFDSQKVEAAYRKELVLGEDDANRAQLPVLKDLFQQVRQINYRLYWHYMYFDLARWSYLQFSVVVPLIALAPSLIAGVLTLGLLQQILRAFNKVLDSFQFLVNSWTTIIELLSIYKRLQAFERHIRDESISILPK